MEIDNNNFNERKMKAKSFYTSQNSIYCPFFGKHIILNSDGFHHLQYSSRRERDEKEQILKFNLLPLAFEVIRKAGTVQEYRTLLIPMGKKSSRGEVTMKQAQFWGFNAIIGKDQIKIRTIIRQVGDGHITFWSVMPLIKLKKGVPRKLFTDGIEDD